MAVTPRTRTRAAAPVVPETTPEAPMVRPRIQRHAAPTPPPVPAARVRSRTAPAPVVTTGLVTGLVEVEHRVNGESRGVAAEIVQVPRRMPDGTFEPAMVRVGGGATIQPRQYESVRVEVSLTLPCFPSAEQYEAAYTEASAWVEDKIRLQVQLALEG